MNTNNDITEQLLGAWIFPLNYDKPSQIFQTTRNAKAFSVLNIEEQRKLFTDCSWRSYQNDKDTRFQLFLNFVNTY